MTYPFLYIGKAEVPHPSIPHFWIGLQIQNLHLTSNLIPYVSLTPFLETNEDIVVTWSTLSCTDSSLVWYGRKKIEKAVQGTSVKFVDGGSEHREMWIHRVTLSCLQPDTTYGELIHSVVVAKQSTA